MKLFLLLVILIIYSTVFSQEINKIIIDEKYDEPILIGRCDRNAFNDSNFVEWFNEEYEFYIPSFKNKKILREKLLECKITIVMGTWCSDSRMEVPGFYKVLDELEYPDESVLLITVDNKKTAPDNLVDALDIELVPTFIIYKDDEELGRITEVPETSLEGDLEIILKIKNTSK